MKLTQIDELLERYRVFLIDAYGVLVTSSGVLPGASRFIDKLHERGHSFFILTNDASRLPETCAAYYLAQGLSVPLEKIITAGMAIGPALDELGITRARCFVLGTRETRACVERAGHEVVDVNPESDFDAIVIGDDAGFDFLPTMNALLTAVHRQRLAGKKPAILVANSDVLYPTGPKAYGFTSGTLAHLLQLGLAQLHSEDKWQFDVLGKPAPRLFNMALAQAQCPASEVVMLGDQLHTDVKGANGVGISSALVATGVTQLPLPSNLPPELRPKYVLRSL